MDSVPGRKRMSRYAGEARKTRARSAWSRFSVSAVPVITRSKTFLSRSLEARVCGPAALLAGRAVHPAAKYCRWIYLPVSNRYKLISDNEKPIAVEINVLGNFRPSVGFAFSESPLIPSVENRALRKKVTKYAF